MTTEVEVYQVQSYEHNAFCKYCFDYYLAFIMKVLFHIKEKKVRRIFLGEWKD